MTNESINGFFSDLQTTGQLKAKTTRYMSPRLKQKKIVLERKKQILSAAVKIFATRGFANTTISDIASAAGLSHGLIYHYFKTKDDVFTELIKLAHDHFLGSLEYASKINAGPLEKICIFTELVTPKDYSEESAYYSNVILQAHSSRGLPKAVKKIIYKNISKHNEMIILLIKEGQKLEQIIREDPVKLANAHYSMLLGMQGMHILITDFPDYPISIIDPDTVIRVLKNPYCNDNLQVLQKLKSKFRKIQMNNKAVICRFRENSTDSFKIFKIKMFEKTENGQKVFRFEKKTESGEITISVIQADNLLPLYTETRDSKQKLISKTVYKTVYTENSVTFNIPGRNFKKTIELHGDYLDSRSLFWIFHGFPFESSDKIEFILVDDGNGKADAGHYMMAVRKTGMEKLNVPAGEFNCYKLKMTPGVMGEDYADMYSMYFWYTVNEPHFFIKYEGSDGKLIELIKVE